jgi:uncharacterized membrane-anchored protein
MSKTGIGTGLDGGVKSWAASIRDGGTAGLTVLIAAAALVQLGILTTMVSRQISVLSSGREIVMPIVPVDPRDLFRGEYVTLSFPISSVPGTFVDRSVPSTGNAFYVTIRPVEGGWTASRIGAQRPVTVAANEIVLKGRPVWGMDAVFRGTTTQNLAVHYGVERFYVPEGQGRRLEDLARNKKLAVLLAVGPDGTAAIKGLMIDGQRVYDEPLL